MGGRDFTNSSGKRYTVAKDKLGTKRVCPETGRKFYDLNKDPIVSPYTGNILSAVLFHRIGHHIEGEERSAKPKPDEDDDDDDEEEVEVEVEDDGGR